jgi:hypothetical protein
MSDLLPRTEVDPELGELIRSFDELHNSPPRVVAIVGVALVEDRLRDAILRRLIDDPAVQKKFFKDVVCDHFGKIRLAYALQIISSDIKRNLETLGEIRNRFAHQSKIRDFNHSELDGTFGKLTLRRRVQKEMPALAADLKVHDHSPREDQFRHSVHFALWYLGQDSFNRNVMGVPRP